MPLGEASPLQKLGTPQLEQSKTQDPIFSGLLWLGMEGARGLRRAKDGWREREETWEGV